MLGLGAKGTAVYAHLSASMLSFIVTLNIEYWLCLFEWIKLLCCKDEQDEDEQSHEFAGFHLKK